MPQKKLEQPLARKLSKLLLPVIQKYFRAKYLGLENIPDTPFIGVGNHLGVYFIPESYLWLGKYHTLKGKPPMTVLVHKAFHQLTSVFNFTEKDFGIIKANPTFALESLEAGNAITVYPGGDRENTKPFSERNRIDFYDHTGYIKLALRSGCPIVPIVGIGGGETLFVLSSGEQLAKRSQLARMFKIHTWPLYWSFPFGFKLGHFNIFQFPLPSQITISVLPPIKMDTYLPHDADNPHVVQMLNEKIMRLMQEEMNKLAKGRIPVIGKLF